MHNVIGNNIYSFQKEIDSKETKARSKSQLLHLNQAAAIDRHLLGGSTDGTTASAAKVETTLVVLASRFRLPKREL